MEQRGRAPANGNWKRFPKCPYCGKDSAGLFEAGRGERFKCHHTSCPSGTAAEGGAWDEVGFLAHELSLSRKEAFLVWLKEAGVKRAEIQKPKAEGIRSAETMEDDFSEFEDLPPTEPAGIDQPAGPSHDVPGSRIRPRHGDGLAAVPEAPIPFDDGVSASPAGEPTLAQPDPGEAPIFPATTGTPGEPSAIAESIDADPPDDFEGVQTPALEDQNREADGEGGSEAGGGEPPEEAPKCVQAIRCFYERLELTQEDLDRLWSKRGLVESVCRLLGFRSSLRTNEKILWEMRDKFPLTVLLDSCLWVERDGLAAGKPAPRPNPQYYGWGAKGKIKRRTEGPTGWEEALEWDFTHPILIPYLNGQGEVMDLRPHKMTQYGQSPRLYIPTALREPIGATDPKRIAEMRAWLAGRKEATVFTEGEFKAAALWQVLGHQALIAGLPGITMSKPLFGDIADLLMAGGTRRPAIVVFDNEDKSTPGKPGYKEEEWKRLDTPKWARYLARRIVKEGFAARVGRLPDEWRDGNGKADWDGALALLLRQEQTEPKNE